MWRRIVADECEWEIRAMAAGGEGGPESAGGAEEILEFRPVGDVRPPRRLLVAAGTLAGMDETALQSAFRQARPIGADFYGRPGKRMKDTGA